MEAVTLLFKGSLNLNVFTTSEQMKGYKERASLREQSNEASNTDRSSLDMSRQVL